MSYQQVCPVENFDAGTGTCSELVWVSTSGFLPPLDVTEGLLVSSAMMTCVATAWAFKAVRRYFSRS